MSCLSDQTSDLSVKLLWIQTVGTTCLSHISATICYVFKITSEEETDTKCTWILPLNNEARGTIQYFNIFVSEAPVDAEMAVSEGLVGQIHIVAVQK